MSDKEHDEKTTGGMLSDNDLSEVDVRKRIQRFEEENGRTATQDEADKIRRETQKEWGHEPLRTEEKIPVGVIRPSAG